MDIGPIAEGRRKAGDTGPAAVDIGPIAAERRKAEDTGPAVEDIGPIVAPRSPDTDPAAEECHSAAQPEVRDSSVPGESGLAAGPSFRPTAGSGLFQFAANCCWPPQVRRSSTDRRPSGRQGRSRPNARPNLLRARLDCSVQCHRAVNRGRGNRLVSQLRRTS